MILQLQAQTSCFPAIKFKPYSIWDDVLLILMMVSILILYVVCSYYLLYILKFVTDRLKKCFNNENN
ncbi:hypothetical protein EG359_11250 [Chryseobacterium joostei]|uniref:Uncharacterized protein n=1 Tax=Chryseobacterium joostei TaxID=112234 RepID=A0ABN5SBF1_9FLAO|nr:hypothetical protein EG359_11250 [Chryseobacterium joostei]